MGRIDDRLQALGITLPAVFPPVGSYTGCAQSGTLLYVGGHGPVNGTEIVTGKVGDTVSLDEARRECVEHRRISLWSPAPYPRSVLR